MYILGPSNVTAQFTIDGCLFSNHVNFGSGPAIYLVLFRSCASISITSQMVDKFRRQQAIPIHGPKLTLRGQKLCFLVQPNGKQRIIFVLNNSQYLPHRPHNLDTEVQLPSTFTTSTGILVSFSRYHYNTIKITYFLVCRTTRSTTITPRKMVEPYT